MRPTFLAFVLLATTAGQAVAADLLTIGSPAPPLKVDTWVKGDPVSGIEKGKVYVIEFWGTTCVPCIQCMPHLSDLQRQHKAVIFACLSGEPEQKIRAFVAKNDKNMGFRVGVSGKGRMWKSWMEAAGLEGTPTAFIVDALGKIAWIGNPAEMDEPLRQIVEGKYDPQLAIIGLRFRQALAKADRKEDERLDRGSRLAVQVEKLIAEKKTAEAEALVDRAIQQEPGERVYYGVMKLQALVADPKLADKALEYGIELAAAAAARADMPTHQVLLNIASNLASPSSDAPPDARCCELALEVVKWAQEVARQQKKSSDQDLVEWGIRTDSILAQVYAGKGEFDQAVTHAERALQSCRKALPPPSADEAPSAGRKQFRQDMENRAKMLEVYLADFKKKASTAPRK
jgi:thiol-disulfide isomerase/thioredoxin